jgi:hypothetical protein
MDIFRKLQSILSPPPGSAIRSQPKVPKPAELDLPSFADALRSAGEVPFGVTIDRIRRGASAAGQDKLQIDTSAPETGRTVATEPQGPAVIADAPDGRNKEGVAIEALHIELRETLESVIGLERDRAAESTASTGPTAAAEHDKPAAATDPTIAETPAETPVAPARLALPPIGIHWSPAALAGSGRVGHGIDGTADGTSRQIRIKVQLYLHPEVHGVQLNTEARLFRDAIDKGYVTADEAGLATLLGQLSRGSIGPNGRPQEITNYFKQFFAAERAAGLA